MRITECPECHTRYRVREEMVSVYAGKHITCKRCRARFKIEFESPTVAEEESAKQKASMRTRRTKAEIRDEHVTTVRDGFRQLHARLAAIDDTPNSSEEEVRRWILDVLRTTLGFDDSEIVTEARVHDRKADIIIQPDPQAPPCFVYEIKNIRRALNQRVIDQAASYAAGLNAPYAVVTNGAVWRLLKTHVATNGSTSMIEVFDVALLDDDGVSDDDAEALYLLSKRAVTISDTEKYAHAMAALQPSRVFDGLRDEAVIKKLRTILERRYQDSTEVKVSLDDDLVLDQLDQLLSADTL